MTIWRFTRAWTDPDMQRKAEWVAAMMSASESTAAKLKVSPEAIVAQAALESGWGQAKVGNCGLFGVKADASWTGARVLCRTREFYDGEWETIDDAFRDYPTYQAAIEDHFTFLDQNSRYRAAGVFAGGGDESYFAALKRAGYATDPNYAATLQAVEQTIRYYFLRFMEPIDGQPAHVEPRALMVGCSGADVAALQRALGVEQDSAFGPRTLDALKNWQSAHGLQADGIVGPITRARLGL